MKNASKLQAVSAFFDQSLQLGMNMLSDKIKIAYSSGMSCFYLGIKDLFLFWSNLNIFIEICLIKRWY